MPTHLLRPVAALFAIAHALPAASAEDIDTIIISATRGPATGSLPVSVGVIDREAIEASAGVSIDEILRAIPGVQLPLSGSNANFPANPSVAIRGLGLGDNGTRTLVLIDGVPANGGFFGNIFWNRVPTERVERIEIVRGGGSSLFGAFAQGGVIQVITRKPGDEWAARAKLQGGRFDLYAADAALSGPITDRISAGLDAGYARSDGFFEVIESQRGAIDTPTGYENTNAAARLDFAPSDRTSAYVRGGFFDQNQGGISALSRTFTRLMELASGVSHETGAGTFDTTLFYQDERFQTFSPRADAARNVESLSFTSVTGSQDFGGSLVYSVSDIGIARSLSLGVDGRRIEGDNDAQTLTPSGGLFLDETNVGVQRAIGLFAEADLNPTPRLGILLNLRGDFYRNGDAREVENGIANDLPANRFSELSFRAAGRYRLIDGVAIRAAVYRAFRAPTLSELYRSFGTSSFQGLANPELEAETLVGGEIGVDFDPATGGHFEVNLFHNAVDGFIGGVPVAFFPVFTLQNFNLGDIRSRGVELIAEMPLTQYASATMGYSYLDAKVTSNPEDTAIVGNFIEGAPRHSLHWGLRLTDWHGVGADLRGRYISAQFQDVGNETQLGGHVVVDLGLRYQMRPGLELFAKGENILDEAYEASGFGGLIQRGQPANIVAGLRLGL